MKTFFSVFAAILCAAAVIKGISVAANRWMSTPAVAPTSVPPPAPEKGRVLQNKPRIALRSLTEIGVIVGIGTVTVTVLDERIDYAEGDEVAQAMADEAKLATYLTRVTVDHGSRKTVDLDTTEVTQLLAGIERLPVPFIAHSDRASASFRFRDRFTVSVLREAKKNALEIALDDVAVTTEIDQLAVFKDHLQAATKLMVSRDNGQRTPLTPTWSPTKKKGPEFIPLQSSPTNP